MYFKCCIILESKTSSMSTSDHATLGSEDQQDNPLVTTASYLRKIPSKMIVGPDDYDNGHVEKIMQTELNGETASGKPEQEV